MRYVAGFFGGFFVTFVLLTCVSGCGRREVKPNASEQLKARLIYLNTDINLLRGDIRDLQDELQRTRCKCNGHCGEKQSADTKRLDALLDHASAMSKITAVYFHYATPDVCEFLDDEAGDKMGAALREAREVINRNAILFDVEFNIDADRYYEVFRQMNHLWVTEWHEYRVFVAALTNSFDDICKERIARMEGKGAKDVRMPLAPIPYEERIKMKARDYLQKMLEYSHISDAKQSALKRILCTKCGHPKYSPARCPHCGFFSESNKQSALPAFPLRTCRIADGEVLMGWLDADGRECEATMTEAEFNRLCDAKEASEPSGD